MRKIILTVLIGICSLSSYSQDLYLESPNAYMQIRVKVSPLKGDLPEIFFISDIFYCQNRGQDIYKNWENQFINFVANQPQYKRIADGYSSIYQPATGGVYVNDERDYLVNSIRPNKYLKYVSMNFKIYDCRLKQSESETKQSKSGGKNNSKTINSNNNTQSVNSQNKQQIINQTSNIISDLSQGNSTEAGLNSALMTAQGIKNLDGTQTIAGLGLGVASLFTTKKPNGYVETEVFKAKNGLWVKANWSNGIAVGDHIYSEDQNFNNVVAVKRIIKPAQYKNDYAYYIKKGYAGHFLKEGSNIYKKYKDKDFVHTVEWIRNNYTYKVDYAYSPDNKPIDINNLNNSFRDENLETIDKYSIGTAPEFAEFNNGKLLKHHKFGEDGFIKRYYKNGNIAYKFNSLSLNKGEINSAFYSNGQPIYKIELSDAGCLTNNEITIYKPNGEVSHNEIIDNKFDCEKGKYRFKWLKRYLSLDYRNIKVYYTKPQTIYRYHTNGNLALKLVMKQEGKKTINIWEIKYDENGNLISNESFNYGLKDFLKGGISFKFI